MRSRAVALAAAPVPLYAGDLPPSRSVRGLLFVDYVRMVRSSKAVDWSRYLTAEDLACIGTTIDTTGWYPMETFERLGLGILAEVARGQLDGVRMWGRFQVQTVIDAYPDLVVDGDPYQSMMRFRVFSRSFFDFDAIDVPTVEEGRAEVSIGYGMSPRAEETACHQTLGFFEGLLQRAGGQDIAARFTARGWEGASRTEIEIAWA